MGARKTIKPEITKEYLEAFIENNEHLSNEDFFKLADKLNIKLEDFELLADDSLEGDSM